MRFSVYVLRDDPDYAIFDVELLDPRSGHRIECDCAGVFEVEEGAQFVWNNTERGCGLMVVDEWVVFPQQILLGDFKDPDTGNVAPIVRLWPS